MTRTQQLLAVIVF